MNHSQHITHREDETTGWVGWLVFASFLMGLAGIFQIIAAMAAFFKDSVFLVGQDKLVFLNFTQWGWVHLIIGIIMFTAALSLSRGALYGRIIGVMLAFLSAIANFVFIQAYPLWSIMIILVDIIVIYSILMHGNELRVE